MAKVKTYKGHTVEISKTIGFFSTGRSGKLKTKVWISKDPLGISGQWFDSWAKAKSHIDQESKLKKEF